MTAQVRFSVPPDRAGERLDLVLPAMIPRLSRRAARRLIEQGSVFVDGRRVRVQSRVVPEGAVVLVAREEPAPRTRHRVPVVHDDTHLLAVSKPAGMPTEPTREASEGTVQDTLLRAERAGGRRRPFLHAAHRLDADTSGVVLFARSKAAAAHMGDAFRTRTIQRAYIALVWGHPDFAPTVLDGPLGGKDKRGNRRIDPAGKPSETVVTVLARGTSCSLLAATPLTGRTHQIRVHLSAAGFPLLGDRRYGKPDDDSGALGLHALALRFVHPELHRLVTITAPPPAAFVDMAARDGIAPPVVAEAADALTTGWL